MPPLGARPSASVLAAPPSVALSPSEFNAAREFRRTFGLRSDDEWIVHVAADPASSAGEEMYGIPLSPDELADLVGRPAKADAVYPVIAAYGASVPDEWAGAFVDQSAGGKVAALFTSNRLKHQGALQRVLGPAAWFVVREVRYTLAELEVFEAQVEAQAGWFETIGAVFAGTHVYVQDNRVHVRYEAPDATIDAAVAEHFGNPDWLAVRWSGPAEWTGPTGTLVVNVVDSAGRNQSDLDCWIDDVRPVLKGDGTPFVTGDDGRCVYLNYPAAGYDITITEGDADHRVVLATRRVAITPNERTTITIVVQRE